jgi:cytochrome P450
MTGTAHLPAEVEQAALSVFAPDSEADPAVTQVRTARLRELDPMYWCAPLGMWLATGYAECQRILTDTATFLATDCEWNDIHQPGWRESRALFQSYSLLVFQNPPAHTRLRHLVTRDFAVRRVQDMRPALERAAAQVLDRLADAGADGSPVNVVDALSYPLAYSVISELLGLPRGDRELFEHLLDDILKLFDPHTDAEVAARADAAAWQAWHYTGRLVEQRSTDPGGDLVSALLAVNDTKPDRMTMDEVRLMVLQLLFAGYETVTSSLSTGLMALLTDPAQYDLLLRDPSYVPGAVEEILRWAAPVQIVRRYAARDAEVGAAHVPAGSITMVMLGAANRDPAKFREPDRFDVTRNDGHGLAFGAGIHLCLGAALAGAELAVTLRQLAERFPRIALSGPVRWRPSVAVRTLWQVPVVLDGGSGRVMSDR